MAVVGLRPLAQTRSQHIGRDVLVQHALGGLRTTFQPILDRGSEREVSVDNLEFRPRDHLVRELVSPGCSGGERRSELSVDVAVSESGSVQQLACRLLEALGFEVYAPDMSMFQHGGGGVHCLSQELRRDPA